jgi:hypothetical protein
MPDQLDILEFLIKKNDWVTSKEVVEYFKLDFSNNTHKTKIQIKLNSLAKYKFIKMERLMKESTNNQDKNIFLYKVIK